MPPGGLRRADSNSTYVSGASLALPEVPLPDLQPDKPHGRARQTVLRVDSVNGRKPRKVESWSAGSSGDVGSAGDATPAGLQVGSNGLPGGSGADGSGPPGSQRAPKCRTLNMPLRDAGCHVDEKDKDANSDSSTLRVAQSQNKSCVTPGRSCMASVHALRAETLRTSAAGRDPKIPRSVTVTFDETSIQQDSNSDEVVALGSSTSRDGAGQEVPATSLPQACDVSHEKPRPRNPPILRPRTAEPKRHVKHGDLAQVHGSQSTGGSPHPSWTSLRLLRRKASASSREGGISFAASFSSETECSMVGPGVRPMTAGARLLGSEGTGVSGRGTAHSRVEAGSPSPARAGLSLKSSLRTASVPSTVLWSWGPRQGTAADEDSKAAGEESSVSGQGTGDGTGKVKDSSSAAAIPSPAPSGSPTATWQALKLQTRALPGKEDDLGTPETEAPQQASLSPGCMSLVISGGGAMKSLKAPLKHWRQLSSLQTVREDSSDPGLQSPRQSVTSSDEEEGRMTEEGVATTSGAGNSVSSGSGSGQTWTGEALAKVPSLSSRLHLKGVKSSIKLRLKAWAGEAKPRLEDKFQKGEVPVPAEADADAEVERHTPSKAAEDCSKNSGEDRKNCSKNSVTVDMEVVTVKEETPIALLTTAPLNRVAAELDLETGGRTESGPGGGLFLVAALSMDSGRTGSHASADAPPLVGAASLDSERTGSQDSLDVPASVKAASLDSEGRRPCARSDAPSSVLSPPTNADEQGSGLEDLEQWIEARLDSEKGSEVEGSVGSEQDGGFCNADSASESEGRYCDAASNSDGSGFSTDGDLEGEHIASLETAASMLAVPDALSQDGSRSPSGLHGVGIQLSLAAFFDAEGILNQGVSSPVDSEAGLSPWSNFEDASEECEIDSGYESASLEFDSEATVSSWGMDGDPLSAPGWRRRSPQSTRLF